MIFWYLERYSDWEKMAFDANKKAASKAVHVENINRDDTRLLTIKGVYESGSIDPDEVWKLVKAVGEQKNSTLNPGYVQQMLASPGCHVVAYTRNAQKLPVEEGWTSGFILYNLDIEKTWLTGNKSLVSKVHALASFDPKKNITNLLEISLTEGDVKVVGAGTQALDDLEKFMLEFAIKVKATSCEIRE